MRLIERDELELLATGAWILGAGGGGNPYLAWLNLCILYKNGTRVALLDPMALADDDAVAIVASDGAPLVGRERLSDPGFATRPLLALQAHLGCRFRAVMPALPLAMADIRGTEVIVPRAADPQWMSRIARKVLGEMGAVAATCRAP